MCRLLSSMMHHKSCFGFLSHITQPSESFPTCRYGCWNIQIYRKSFMKHGRGWKIVHLVKITHLFSFPFQVQSQYRSKKVKNMTLLMEYNQTTAAAPCASIQSAAGFGFCMQCYPMNCGHVVPFDTLLCYPVQSPWQPPWPSPWCPLPGFWLELRIHVKTG